MEPTATAHRINGLRFDNDTICVTIDEKALRFPLKRVSTRLLKASPEERTQFRLSSGECHWPEIGEAISADTLLNIIAVQAHAGF